MKAIQILVGKRVAATVPAKEADAYISSYERLFPTAKVSTREVDSKPEDVRKAAEEDRARENGGRGYEGWADVDHQIASPSSRDHGLGTDLAQSIRELNRSGQCLSLSKSYDTDAEKRKEEDLVVELTNRLRGRVSNDNVAEAAVAFRKALVPIRDEAREKKVALLERLTSTSGQGLQSKASQVTDERLVETLSSQLSGKVSEAEQVAIEEILRNSLAAIDKESDKRKRSLLDTLTGGERAGEEPVTPFSMCAEHSRYFMSAEEELDHKDRVHQPAEKRRWAY